MQKLPSVKPIRGVENVPSSLVRSLGTFAGFCAYAACMVCLGEYLCCVSRTATVKTCMNSESQVHATSSCELLSRSTTVAVAYVSSLIMQWRKITGIGCSLVTLCSVVFLGVGRSGRGYDRRPRWRRMLDEEFVADNYFLMIRGVELCTWETNLCPRFGLFPEGRWLSWKGRVGSEVFGTWPGSRRRVCGMVWGWMCDVLVINSIWSSISSTCGTGHIFIYPCYCCVCSAFALLFYLSTCRYFLCASFDAPVMAGGRKKNKT